MTSAKFISRKTQIKYDRDIVAPILNAVPGKVTAISYTATMSVNIARQNYNCSWEKKYLWLFYEDGFRRLNINMDNVMHC